MWCPGFVDPENAVHVPRDSTFATLVSLVEEDVGSSRPPQTSSSDSSGSSESDASSADTVSGEEETAGSELRMEQSCEEELVQRVLEELHDFGASSQWVLQVMSSRARGRVRGRAGALAGSLSLSDSGL